MRRIKHWWQRRRNPDQHQTTCTCQVVAYIWIGRGTVQPGAPMGPGEVEVVEYGR